MCVPCKRECKVVLPLNLATKFCPCGRNLICQEQTVCLNFSSCWPNFAKYLLNDHFGKKKRGSAKIIRGVEWSGKKCNAVASEGWRVSKFLSNIDLSKYLIPHHSNINLPTFQRLDIISLISISMHTDKKKFRKISRYCQNIAHL